MGNIKQINIKNWTYYFHYNMINIEEFKFTKNWQKIIQRYWYLVYWIHHNLKNWWLWKYLQRKSIIGKVRGYIEENNGNKYLVFDSIDENKAVLKRYTERWDGIRNEIQTINSGKKGEYSKDFTKIKFNIYDNIIYH